MKKKQESQRSDTEGTEAVVDEIEDGTIKVFEVEGKGWAWKFYGAIAAGFGSEKEAGEAGQDAFRVALFHMQQEARLQTLWNEVLRIKPNEQEPRLPRPYD